MFNTEELERMRRLFTDPDWKNIEKMFRGYIDPLVDINSIDLVDNSTNVKAEIKARKHFYNLVNRFFSDVDVIVSGKEVTAIDPRDSME